MSLIRKSINEIEKFGLYEWLLHIFYAFFHDEQAKTKSYILRDRYYKKLSLIEIENEIKSVYGNVMGYELNIKNPITFTEKIQWLKIYDSTEKKTLIADKFSVRDWIREKGLSGLRLIPLLNEWDDIDDVDFADLPDTFCLKMNHGSGMNYVVTDKARMSEKKVRKLFRAWQARSYYVQALEFHYMEIPRKILAEQYMEEPGGLYDYKIHCFHGEPVFIQCIGDRDLKRHTGRQNNFDLHWRKLDWIFEDYPEFPYEVPRPKHLDEMLTYARALSEDFLYVRVDLYEVNDDVYFGEMTFTPASGLYPYKGSWNREIDERLGSLLCLPLAT